VRGLRLATCCTCMDQELVENSLETDRAAAALAQQKLATTVEELAFEKARLPDDVAKRRAEAVVAAGALAKLQDLDQALLRKLSHPQLLELARRMRECRIALARSDVNEFTRLVIRNEETGKPVQLARHHAEWHDFLDAHKRCVVWAHIEAAKSSTFCVARVLWLLGRNPGLRIAIVSNTDGQAQKPIRAVARYIEQSGTLRQIFPKLRKGEPWTTHQLFVPRDTFSRDPSVQSCGIHGNILGSRLDMLIMDDVLDYENCRTASGRQDIWEWYQSTLAGRLIEEGRTIVCGTAFHPDDLMHRLADVFHWPNRRWPVVRPDGTPNWPERWSAARIEDKRSELTPIEFERQLMCQPRDEATQRFKEEWITTCLRQGDGIDPAYSLEEAFDSDPELEAFVRLAGGVWTGVDLAVEKKSSSDDTVLFTFAVLPNGKRRVLWIEGDKLAGPEIIRRIVDTHQRFGSIVGVESVAAQKYIVQFAHEQTAVPVYPIHTGKNKHSIEFGVESLAAEFMAGKWIIPNRGGKTHPQITKWLNELRNYDPKLHTGDRVMANWIGRELVRSRRQEAPRVGFRVIG
jgi:hypothetical protein